MISIFLGRWRAGRPIAVYGPGTAERDYVYVADVADAVLAALDGTVSGVYNIGTGIATSVNAEDTNGMTPLTAMFSIASASYCSRYIESAVPFAS